MLIHLRIVYGHFTLYPRVAVTDILRPPQSKVVIKWLLTEGVYQPPFFILLLTPYLMPRDRILDEGQTNPWMGE